MTKQSKKPTYRVAIIGDVHGQSKALKQMVRKLENHGVDRIISVGDLLDRGPDSQGCVEFMRTHEFKTRTGETRKLEMILGNHEDSHLRVYLGIPWPGETTVWKTSKHPQVFNSLKDEDWQYLLSQTYMLRDERLDVTVVHGGVMPEDKALGWMSEDRLSLTGRTGYIGMKGERLKPGFFSKTFWTDHYDGRFGRIVYGHTTFDSVRFTENTVGVDGSKKGKLFAVVIGEGEKDKTFSVTFWKDRPKPKKTDWSGWDINKELDRARSFDRKERRQESFSWERAGQNDDMPFFGGGVQTKSHKSTDPLAEVFLSMKRRKPKKRLPKPGGRFEASQELIDRVNKKK